MHEQNQPTHPDENAPDVEVCPCCDGVDDHSEGCANGPMSVEEIDALCEALANEQTTETT